MVDLLPLVGDPPPERSDAVRNRELLLRAAHALVARCGVEAVTTDAVATEAGVGKGTVFRRFGSREGLMTAVLDDSEKAWQAAVISGEPPLGPGAPPWDRLVALGRSRLETTLLNADLIRAAGGFGRRSGPAHLFTVLHVRHLLRELGVTGDLPMLATALLAPLEVPLLDPDLRRADFPVDRVLESWTDLARRIVRE
ncbi:TetR/AcrR family transcriptional regulator [Nocardioides sp. CFH 31398]|uniref:TetR/AcrR family transcriptional regulator n=1 Tax=Nocardioides sp. CFH 31398 TaxID=2919579 RepID=UPI001F061FA2|nr:TetR/AcrR family transcriptional regulator [Nocardioides sp. CFH 31398]MCH1867336.1 TetR/AcrR family transcriptional regulator [Nocardioides sp. CFH 31398]